MVNMHFYGNSRLTLKPQYIQLLFMHWCSCNMFKLRGGYSLILKAGSQWAASHKSQWQEWCRCPRGQRGWRKVLQLQDADAVESLKKSLNGIQGSIRQQRTDGLYLLNLQQSEDGPRMTKCLQVCCSNLYKIDWTHRHTPPTPTKSLVQSRDIHIDWLQKCILHCVLS